MTLLNRPELARYVRHVTETGAIHCSMSKSNPDIIQHTLDSLALCTNLRSLTWVDDSSCSVRTLPAILAVVRRLPLRALTIRTHKSLGADVWAQITTLAGVTRVALWCMEGPPLTLRGSTAPLPLGMSLTDLELGVSAFAYPPAELLARLPHIQVLRLKGAPAAAIPGILACLPTLSTLDTEYIVGCRTRGQDDEVEEDEDNISQIPALRHLTLRTSSLDVPHRMWSWLCTRVVPRSGLETFRLHALSYSFPTVPHARQSPRTEGVGYEEGDGTASIEAMNAWTGILRCFLRDMSARHWATLSELVLGDAPLTLADIHCACTVFPRLTVLGCALGAPDVDAIISVISPAVQLTTLKLNIQWHRNDNETLSDEVPAFPDASSSKFTLADARRMMCRSEGSKLRSISIGYVLYTGKWVLKEQPGNIREILKAKEGHRYGVELCRPGTVLEFVVSATVADERWKT